MLPGHKFGYIEKRPVALPSPVKKLPLKKTDKDRVAGSLLRNGTKLSTPKRKRKDSDVHNCSKKALLNSSTCDENNSDAVDSLNPKSCTVLRNWYLLLSVNGHLVVEGNVKCNILTRSHAIAKRITNTKVQSIYKRIYILEGNLMDNRREVPEYVRRKFHNGFPDDWEKVYKLWNKYLDTGAKASFKWPTSPTTATNAAGSLRSPFTPKFNNKKFIKNCSEQCLQDQQNKSPKTSLNSSMTRDNEKSITFDDSDCAQIKGCKVFSHWRILINDEGQLIIEGTLECGSIARSKPIIKRFTNKKVLCICKWIYILDGSLVNEKNDLPDYVRWKFYNGFPVDWKNVHRHWKNYLVKRSKFTVEVASKEPNKTLN